MCADIGEPIRSSHEWYHFRLNKILVTFESAISNQILHFLSVIAIAYSQRTPVISATRRLDGRLIATLRHKTRNMGCLGESTKIRTAVLENSLRKLDLKRKDANAWRCATGMVYNFPVVNVIYAFHCCNKLW